MQKETDTIVRQR